MKKLLLVVFMFAVTLGLSGCDFFEDKGLKDVWYNNENGSIVLSYNLPTPSEDTETGETPSWQLNLEVKHEDDSEWVYLTTLENFSEENLEIPFNNDQFGNFEVRITVMNNDAEINSFGPFSIWIEEPQFLYHFDVWFDGWNGAVNVNYGLDFRNVDTIELFKSNDGGLNWSSVLEKEILEDDMQQITYYEFEEGNYVFKLKAYQNGEELEELTSYNEIMIYFEKDKYVGEMELWYAEASFDIYSQTVYVWWDCQGEFEYANVYKSTDLLTWELVEEIPYYVKSLSYTEDVEGVYFYKVELINADESLSIETNELRVRKNAVLNDINGWYDYNTNAININWDFYSEDVEVVLVERSVNDSEFMLLGEFGNLKKMFTDEDVSAGSVTYKVSVFDGEGSLLDSLYSQEFFIEQREYLYNIWTWYNWDSEYIELGIEFYDYDSVTLLLERSINDSEFEVLELQDYYNYKDFITSEGTYTYRVSVLDETGTVIETKETVVYDVSLPSFIYHFDVWHNDQNGVVEFHYGLNYNVDFIVISKSTDGGLTWTPILDQAVVLTDDGWIKDNTNYLEEAEGEYVYKLEAFNTNSELLDEMTTYYEIIIRYDHLNLDSEIDINYIDANFNIYDNQVYIWFGTSGTYHSHLIERSTDGENFEFVQEVSRLVTNIWFTEDFEGEYYYRVSALDENGVVLDSQTTNYLVRVKFDALINHFYANHTWDNNVELYFEYMGEEVTVIEVLRTDLVTNESVSLGEFGPLKHYVKDENLLSGTYVYTITLFDQDGNVLDTMDSNEITVYTE